LTKFSIQTTKIEKIEKECEDVKTITFKLPYFSEKNFIHPKPGQFLMIWVPGVDEIPMSISNYENNGLCSITVKNVGECTNALHNLNIGDYIGVRGPLGNWFEIPADKNKLIILIAGGIGIAPIKFLSYYLLREKYSFIIIEGAKNKNNIIFLNENDFNMIQNFKLIYCTDDGSYGMKGTAVEQFQKEINTYPKEKIKDLIVYTCGPEKMMYRIFKICEEKNIPLNASLERIMRCGCGICGLCAIDPTGVLVCKDGPIFTLDELKRMGDFGFFSRDFTGKKEAL